MTPIAARSALLPWLLRRPETLDVPTIEAIYEAPPQGFATCVDSG